MSRGVRRPLIGALLVAAVVAAGCGGSDSGDNDDSASSVGIVEIADVQISGSDLPDFSRGSVDLAIGAPAPGVFGIDFYGHGIQINPGDGVGKIIGFFAHWCPHCQQELPAVTGWLKSGELDTNGVQIVAVSTAVDRNAPNYPPSDWFREDGWPAAVIIDSNGRNIAKAYGLAAFPYVVVVAPDGTVAARRAGTQTLEQWRQMVALAS